MLKNRFVYTQPDYILSIVEKPAGWRPGRIDEAPCDAKVLTQHSVASYAEAYDDLVRCNRLALKHNLDRWAVIHAPSSGL